MNNLYETVTNRIVEALENGTVPWVKPWKDGEGDSSPYPYNATTGRAYNGINVMLLWSQAAANGYTSNGWLTYKQAQKIGGNVRKGEKGTQIIFWKFLERDKTDETGKTEKETIPMLRCFTVFNVEQCDGLSEAVAPERVELSEQEINSEVARMMSIADVRIGGNQAFFAPGPDFIQLPKADQFKSDDDYSSTALHELTHWTGHASRLNRDLQNRFGSEAYAFEELVAEMGSAFLCTTLGIQIEGLQHTQYIGSWIKTLKNDKCAIFTAAKLSRKACEFLTEDTEAEEREAA